MALISQYRCPVAKTSGSYLLNWLREARDEAQLYLDAQPGYAQLEEDRKIADRHYPDLFNGLFIGSTGAPSPTGSTANQRVHFPQVKRMLSEMISILGNIEPSWSYNPQNEELRDVSDILDRCKRTWWERTLAVEQIVKCLQWSAVNRTGYIFPVWNPRFHGTPQYDVQNGDIELRVGGPEDYLPLWPNDSHEIQQAYAGTIRVRMPITEFASTWPTLAGAVYPDDVQPGSLIRRTVEGAKRLFSPGGGIREEEYKPGSVPTVTVYWTYIYDMSVNLTGRIVPMGTPGTNNYYEVPAFGSDIPTGLIHASSGQDLTRKARKEDTYLYPWLRLVIWTEQAICYDGPSYWFHGKIPAVKLTLDPWPWSYLGGSMVRDIASMEQAANRALKSIDKRQQLRPNPPRAINEDVFDATTLEAIKRELDTPGGLVKVERINELLMKSLCDPRDLQVDPGEFEYQDRLTNGMMDTLGLNNLQRQSEMRQMPSGDTQEKWLQIAGARTQRKGKLMENFCRQLAPLVGGLILQWYDTPMRHMLHGYKGIAHYDFDLDPGTLVPLDIPGRASLKDTDRQFGSRVSGRFDSRSKRAKYLIAMMSTSIEEGSLLDVTSMTRQLMELRLWSDPEAPKDPITLFESLKMSNIGTMQDSEDKDTRMGRAKLWRRIRLEELLDEQKQSQEIQQGATPEGKTAAAIRDLVEHTVNQSNGGGATGRPEGRPPVFKEPIQMRTVTRPDGSQDVILDSSSKR